MSIKVNSEDVILYNKHWNIVSVFLKKILYNNINGSELYCNGEIFDSHHVSTREFESDIDGHSPLAGEYENNIKKAIEAGELSVVVGGVGHGKSTMINYVIRETGWSVSSTSPISRLYSSHTHV